jgi:aspartyl-tRNA(Asn)/glutamyl-tRNA(Gln) amidotransferase subunit B
VLDMQWETVIGLEIHAQLATRSKIFSASSTAYGAEPNTQANLVDLGYPGVLPVLNGEAVRMAVKFGLATGSKIARRSVFARKNYFYPDLPKGYQISQYELPSSRTARSRSCSMTARARPSASRARTSRRTRASRCTKTSTGCRHRPQPRRHAAARDRLRTRPALGEGSRGVHEEDPHAGALPRHLRRQHAGRLVPLRRERLRAPRRPGRVRHARRDQEPEFVPLRRAAINYEVERQIDLIEGGGKVVQETRLYDPDRGETRSMRSKEEANDYRYFPDPDLLPLAIDEATIEELRSSLPELPDEKAARFVREHGLSDYDAGVLTASRKDLAQYYEAVVTRLGGAQAKLAANWVMGELSGALNRDNLEIAQSRVGAEALAGLLARIADDTISGKIAKEVFEAMWAEGKAADAIIEAKGLKQITDTSAIEKAIEEVMAKNPGQLAEYRSGKDKLFGFFVGQVMKATGGKANPGQLNELLKRKLSP